MISIGLPLGPQSNVKMKNSIKFEAARSLARSQLLSGNGEKCRNGIDSLKEGAKEKGRIENKNKRNSRK